MGIALMITAFMDMTVNTLTTKFMWALPGLRALGIAGWDGGHRHFDLPGRPAGLCAT